MPSQGRLPGEKKPTKIMNKNNMEMKEHPVSPVLLPHKAGALISLIETVTMLQICVCSTFWTQHKSYAKSRFSIIRAFEKTSMLPAAIEQYEERYPERKVKVMKDTQWYVRFVNTMREVPPDPPPTTAVNAHDETPTESADASDATPARGLDGRFVQRPRSNSDPSSSPSRTAAQFSSSPLVMPSPLDASTTSSAPEVDDDAKYRRRNQRDLSAAAGRYMEAAIGQDFNKHGQFEQNYVRDCCHRTDLGRGWGCCACPESRTCETYCTRTTWWTCSIEQGPLSLD